jgi:hypothetical protein
VEFLPFYCLVVIRSFWRVGVSAGDSERLTARRP